MDLLFREQTQTKTPKFWANQERRDGMVQMIFSEAVIFQGDRGNQGRQVSLCQGG